MKISLGITLSAIVPLCVFSQTGSQSPIPAEWLHDGRLVVTALNFSLSSPTPDATWMYQELPDIDGSRATLFLVTTSNDTKYVTVVMEKGGRMDAGSTKKFIEGMQKTLPKDWHVQDVQLDPTPIPAPDSTKFRVTLTAPGYSILYSYGYVIPGKHTYMFMVYSPDTSEPPQFTSFVSSFSLLAPSENAVPASTSANGTSGLLLILAIVGAVVDWRYKKKGGLKPTGRDRLYLLVACLLCVALLTVLGIRGASAESLGSLTGLFLVVLFALWQLGRWRIRRKFPLSAAPSMAPPPFPKV